jgi:2-keto-4-pentenoate hydratase/2-oxohepta-3-ene-1,7-dioic acid hydratase in catechol pathway
MNINPSKIVCVGLNYKKHAAEMGHELPQEPVLFMKPTSSIINDGDEIKYPAMSKRVDYEAELAIVMGEGGTIAGFTCANDVTARDLQQKDGQWTRAKSFDTFCPLGPKIVQVDDPNNLGIKAFLNGKIVQDSNTSDMIFSVDEIVDFISQVMTLNKDDIILTGTPSGIGPMNKGDEIVIEIERIGTLRNTVA